MLVFVDLQEVVMPNFGKIGYSSGELTIVTLTALSKMTQDDKKHADYVEVSLMCE